MTAAATTTQPTCTARQQLQRFCASEFEMRSWMHKPFRIGEWAYATNSHWMARMPAADLGHLSDNDTPKAAANAVAMFAAARFDLLQPMPHIDCPSCPACTGSGRVTWVTCIHCRGKGITGKGCHASECLHCGGYGKTAQPAQAEDKTAHACWHCAGTGFQMTTSFQEKGPRMQHQGAWFQRAYLAALSRLPGIQFAAAPNGELTSAAFRFEGGEGLLMPCHPPRRATA